MATFLELCQQLREEVGVAGSISTTVGQTGMHARLINYIVKASRDIQRKKTNWKFLWAEWSQLLSGVVNGSVAAPDGLSSFDQSSFWVNAGTADAFPLRYVDFKEWRDMYRHQFIDADQPEIVTLKPNGTVSILPNPSTEYAASILTADYWRNPVELINDNQVSLIPVDYHDCIVSLAKTYFAEKSHDTGLYNSALVDFNRIYQELKAHALPGWEDDNKSEASISHVIEIL